MTREGSGSSENVRQSKTRPVQEHTESHIRKVARHLRRFWFAYAVLWIAIVLIITLPIVFVLYRNRVQSDVDTSVIIATDQKILNPTPTGFTFEQSSVLLTSSSYQPWLYPWTGSFYLPNSEVSFLSIDIPGAKAYNGSEFSIQEPVQVDNMTEFISNSKLILSSNNFTIYLRGRGNLKLQAWPQTSVDYNKTINLMGLNNFQGLNVSEFHLLNQTLQDGANAAGTVTLPNPTIFTLQMGNVSFDISVNGTAIGNASMPDLFLTPGNNDYALHVTSNQSQVIELLRLPAYRCGILPIDIRGKESVVNGQMIPYFTGPLQASLLQTTLNLMPALQEAGLGAIVNGSCVS